MLAVISLVFVAAVVWPLLAAAAGNRSASTLPSPLNLDRAVEYALVNNLTLHIAETRIRERGGMLTHARRWVPSNPELEMKAGFRNRPGNDSTDIGIRIAQEFWIAGQGGLMEAAARNRLSASEAQYEYLQAAVAARARRAFLEVLWAREARRTAAESLAIARDLEGYAEQRFAAGEITRLDLNTARLGTARAQNAHEAARAQSERARIGLSAVLSIAPDRVPPITGELDLEPAALPQRDDLLNRSLQRRRDLGAAAANINAARRELELSQRQVIPNLKVFGFYEREGGDERIPGIGISLPLPVFHQYQGETEQSGARLRRSQIEHDALLLEIRREVAAAVADYNSARTRVALVSDRMLQAAQDNALLTQQAFKEGEVGSPALSTVQDTLLSVRDDYLQAVRTLIEAGAALETATGGLVFLGDRPGSPTGNRPGTPNPGSGSPESPNGDNSHE